MCVCVTFCTVWSEHPLGLVACQRANLAWPSSAGLLSSYFINLLALLRLTGAVHQIVIYYLLYTLITLLHIANNIIYVCVCVSLEGVSLIEFTGTASFYQFFIVFMNSWRLARPARYLPNNKYYVLRLRLPLSTSLSSYCIPIRCFSILHINLLTFRHIYLLLFFFRNCIWIVNRHNTCLAPVCVRVCTSLSLNDCFLSSLDIRANRINMFKIDKWPASRQVFK